MKNTARSEMKSTARSEMKNTARSEMNNMAHNEMNNIMQGEIINTVQDTMTYADALEWLFARTRAGDVRSGERTKALLARLGHPEGSLDCIHVIGTNGKGSTCAMLAAGLQQAGFKVGRFTSPHLQDYRERIVVNGNLIPPDAVLEFLQWAQLHAADAAFFDLTTVLGLRYFAQQQVDVAVVEAGVGARHDATASLENVKATVITNVDLDHEATIGVGHLPSVLQNIAFEKAGGIRVGVPVLTAARGAALEVIGGVAQERGAPLYVFSPDDPLFALPHAPALQGQHQLENAALALATLRLLGHGAQALEAALSATWAGRLETLHIGGSTVVLDGAHNPAGAQALAQSLQGQRFALLFAAMSRKRVPDILEPILGLAHELHFVSVSPQGVNPLELAEQYGGTAHLSLESGLAAVLRHNMVLIAGSLYLVGAARSCLIQQLNL
jgi:dihydrofolate synthase / folylpolyglutamate synthase